MTDNEELVRLCINGNSRAQKMLYDTFAPMMLGVCMRYASSRTEAQDLLHDGMVKVFTSLHRLKNPVALEDWIYHIIVNTAVSHLRKKKWKCDGDETVDLLADTCNYDPFAAQELLDVIHSLPDKYRLVFNMYEVEGYSFDEIAQRLGLAPVSVRSILFRAKKMLKEKLKHDVL